MALSLILLFVVALPFSLIFSGAARAETRSLKIYFVHTGERADIVFKRDGRYDAGGLRQLNVILRDWRRNEPTKMDPRLFDLVWEVYRRAGASGYINVVSGYRSPATNSMLRSRSKGVAKESQHMRGTAMDFFIPGVDLARLRELGMRMQVGGVGYYPRSGSPFVHMDVGGVRSWPRMSRQDLVRLFPDGKTMHIPADGRPLPGYEQAVAEYKQRVRSNSSMIAEGPKSPGRSRNLLAMLFGGGDEDEEEDIPDPEERPTLVRQPTRQPPSAPPGQILTAAPARAIASAPPPPAAMPEMVAAAPVPQARPAFAGGQEPSLAAALYSPARSAAEDAVTRVASGDAASGSDFPDLSGMQIPVPTLLGKRGLRGDAEGQMLTASADPNVTGMAANVPVPAARPALAEALLASADAEAMADEADEDMTKEDAVGQIILSPESARALAQSNAAGAPADKPITVASVPKPLSPPMPVATLAAPTSAVPQVEVGMPAPQAAVQAQSQAAQTPAAQTATAPQTATVQIQAAQAAVPTPMAAPVAPQPHVISTPSAAPQLATVTPLPKPAEAPAREVAMLSVPKPEVMRPEAAKPAMPKPASRPADFGDAFDAPKQPSAGGIASGNPEKGRRPDSVDAEAAKRAVTGAPVLTAHMLSTWALNRDRGEAAAKMGKAPRVMAPPAGADSAAFYAVGFQNGQPIVDPGRFGAAPQQPASR